MGVFFVNWCSCIYILRLHISCLWSCLEVWFVGWSIFPGNNKRCSASILILTFTFIYFRRKLGRTRGVEVRGAGQDGAGQDRDGV